MPENNAELPNGGSAKIEAAPVPDTLAERRHTKIDSHLNRLLHRPRSRDQRERASDVHRISDLSERIAASDNPGGEGKRQEGHRTFDGGFGDHIDQEHTGGNEQGNSSKAEAGMDYEKLGENLREAARMRNRRFENKRFLEMVRTDPNFARMIKEHGKDSKKKGFWATLFDMLAVVFEALGKAFGKDKDGKTEQPA